MNKVILIFIVLFIGINSRGWAQNSIIYGGDLFLELKSGKTMRGEITKKEPIFKRKYLLLNDSLKVGLDSVKTYMTADGYYTRVTDRSSIHYQKFAKRIEEGNVDLFTLKFEKGVPYRFVPDVNAPGGFNHVYDPSVKKSSSAEFFSVNGKDVLKANYRNLKGPLSDNPKSMKHLNTYHDMGIASWVIIIGGLGILGGSLTAISDEGGLPAGVYIGLGVTSVGSILGFARKSHLPKAIRAYNE